MHYKENCYEDSSHHQDVTQGTQGETQGYVSKLFNTIKGLFGYKLKTYLNMSNSLKIRAEGERRKPPRGGRRKDDPKDIIEGILKCTAAENKICSNPCKYSFFCFEQNKKNCVWIEHNKGKMYDPFKKTIVIIDDNPGLVSFLLDDLDNILKLEDYNIFTFDSKFAVFKLIATSIFYKITYDYAIIDITYGGVVKTPAGNLKLNGVDAFNFMYNSNKNMKFLFFTGNLLNRYIKTNDELVTAFELIYKKPIDEFVMYKTNVDMEERRKIIAKMFK